MTVLRPLVALGMFVLLPVMASACRGTAPSRSSSGSSPRSLPVEVLMRERVRVLVVDSGVTATIVEPETLDPTRAIELILYALPNGNSTAETMGRAPRDSAEWRYDIQHIAAQTRLLRARGLPQAVVVYLEAAGKSWPEWRRVRGYPEANARIGRMVDRLRQDVLDVDSRRRHTPVRVTLTGHSGGGSFMFGFIEGQEAIPPWVERIAMLDANYNFAAVHGPPLQAWLNAASSHTLVVLAYDDREIMLDGKKVVSDSGGTWRASQRMIDWFASRRPLRRDMVGDFQHWRDASGQVELWRHPNPANRILHTELVGEMNGYLYAMLTRRPKPMIPLAMPGPPRVYQELVSRMEFSQLDREI